MTTSLAEQLKKLAAPQSSILVHTKKKTSLLFDPKDAADIDRGTFYKIGLSGFEELKAIEPRVAEFEKSLFDEASQQLERAVEDQQANAKLDRLINKFLILLSPYLNIKASHKAIEWLICRFHIQQYNLDSLLALALPYHDTNIFARIVQVLSLQEKNGKWEWLQPLKKEGIPMSKLFLLSRASSDTSFFKFICNLPLQGVQVYGEKSYCLTTLFTFYCTTVIGALDQTPQVSEVQVTHLLPSLMAGITSSHLDFTASAFMILGHLVSKIRLTPGIFSELFYKVSKSEQLTLRSEAALVMVVMAQSSRTPSILPSACHLANSSWFRPTLSKLASSGVVVFPLVSALVTDCLSALKNVEGANTQQDLLGLQQLLLELFQDLVFTSDEVGTFLKLFADTPLTGNKWYHDVLNQLEKSYPEPFDVAVKVHPNLLQLIPGYTARNDLFQRLNHPQSHVRLEAILYVKSQKELLKEEWVREALLSRLSDTSTKVVSAVLQMASCLPNSQLHNQLTAVVARSWHATGSLHTIGPLALNRLENNPSLLLLLALPFLLPSGKNGLPTAKAVLNCTVVKQSEIFQPICQKLENNVTEESLSKGVFKFIKKKLKTVNIEDLIKTSKELESHGLVYQLFAVLLSAATLPNQLVFETVQPLLQSVTEYNNSAAISSEVQEDLNENNFASIVSVCRNGKLPFQGSLYVLSTIMSRIEGSASGGQFIQDVKGPKLALVIELFRIVLQMKKSKNIHIAKAYSKFCDNLFKKCSSDLGDQIDLLSNLVLGCPDLASDCLVRLQQLVEELASVREQVLVPALLVALQSTDHQTRHSALSVLHTLTQKLALPTYHRMLDHLNQSSQEIGIDHEQVNVALYMCLSPDPSVQSLLSKALRPDMAGALSGIMDIIVALNTPAYVKASLLKALDQVNSQSLLSKLLPLAMKVLQTDQRSADEQVVLKAVMRRIHVTTAEAFKDQQLWLFLEACLKDHKPSTTDGSVPAFLILQQIDRELFAALSPSLQERLLSLIISCVVETDNSDVTSATASCFKRIALDAQIVATLLEPMRDATVELPPSQNTKKRAWAVKKPPPLQLLSSIPWKQGLCLLEFIQNKKKLDNVQVVLPILFEILNRCLQFEEQSPVEYTKQVLLASLLHCCVKLSPDGSPVDLPESSMQVELVVECIRVSSNPQTHHHALLLLAHIANMIPGRVLHTIMPIFTFMGSTVLRQDDAYSFQIISKIVETIVPVLIKSGEGKEEQELTTEVVGVLRVFAGAMLDIPEHRRTPLFTKLLDTFCQGQFLWAFLSLVFESHILNPTSDNTSAGKELGSIPKRLEVALHLCHQFSPATVLAATCHFIQYLCDLPADKGDKRLQTFKKSTLGALFDVERVTDKQLRHYTYTGLTFLSLLLSSKQFLRVIAMLTLEEIYELKQIFQHIFEGILTFTQSVSKQVDASAGQPTAKYWKSMFNICFDVLAKTNALLPGDMFLSVIASLLDHELVSLRCKALELLNWRLQQAQPLDSEQLLSLLPPLLNLVKVSDITQTDIQLMQQTALLSIKFLARQLAADHPDEFHQAFKASIKLIKKKTTNDPVLASAVLCVGELSHTLGAHAIVSLPSFMPAILSILENHVLLGSGELLLLSVVSALNKIVDSLASFLSPYMDQLIQQICILSANCAQHSNNPKLQPVFQKIKNIRQKISTDVPLRVLLPAVSESYNQLISKSLLDAMPPLLSLLGESFKSGLNLSPELNTFFLTALNFRCQASSLSHVELVEPAVISAIISLVFKLSESSFRPFYYKIFNWAFQDNANKSRSITFYKLTFKIADSLKGLFVSFAHYFLKNAASILDENNKAKQELVWSEACALELINAVLKSLHTVFLYDASHFVNKERFDTLMQSVVDQLENVLGGEEQMEQRTTDLVIPCLTQMAVSAADDTLWKQLNYQILLKTRHNIAQVRIGGVLAVCEIAKKLGEEFLPLLPETVPFLAELLEDENEKVEKTSQRVVQELEAALGEPISKYF